MAAITQQHMISNRLDSAYLQQGGFSQANQRRNQRLTDQHGRRYFAVIEIRSGDPVGPIEPMFYAPLRVPAMYLRKHPDIDRPTELVIDYDRWIADYEAADQEWERRGRELSRKSFGSAYDPRHDAFKQEILDLLGPRPQPVEPVYAAMQGNRWVLGFTRVVDERLAKFFEVEQEHALGIDYSRFDFRDDDEALERQAQAAEPNGTEPVAAVASVPSRPAPSLRATAQTSDFDYETAAARLPDGADGGPDEMRLDEDDDLESQFARATHRVARPVASGESAPGAPPAAPPKRSHHKRKPTAALVTPTFDSEPSDDIDSDLNRAPLP